MPGIVVVTYNSADVIDRCLHASIGIPDSEVVVVDNASTDNTVERVACWPNVRLIANRENRGFAGGVNQGFAALGSEAVLILNPDAAPLHGIGLLERAVAEDGIAAATGQLLGKDGTPQEGFNVRNLPTATTLVFEVLALNRLWPGNPINRRYRLQSPSARADVQQPAAAFLMVRKSAWQRIGGFDESFFPVWFEDVDFCKRLLDSGYRIVYLPEAAAQHVGGHSASQLSWANRQVFWYGSLLRYAWKHLGASKHAVWLAVMLASFPRAVAAVGQVGFAQAIFGCSKVVGLAAKCLRTGERGHHLPATSHSAKEQMKQSR